MGKCKHILVHESPVTPELTCGMDSTGMLCPLHGLPEVRGRDDESLNDYIDNSPNLHEGVLYLTDLTLKGINWGIILGDYHGEIYFSGSEFIDCKFRFMTFCGPAHFAGTRFTNTGFASVAFDSGADFSAAHFDGSKTPFVTCTFKTDSWGGMGEPIDVLFEGTDFEGSAMPFPECSMSGRRVSFKLASIKSSSLNLRIHKSGGDIRRYKGLSISTDKICLSNISFNGHFDYYQDRKARLFAPRVDLQNLMFSSMAAVAFTNANLEKASFTHSVIDNVNFINCQWDSMNGRKAVYDDISRSDVVGEEELRRQNEELLRQYIQLKKNFENQKDFVGAGDWSYREMKCRESIATRWTYRPALWLYRISSQYGENMYYPLGWLAGIWVVAALSYLIIGIPLGDGTSELKYDFGSHCPCRWGDIGIALKFSLMAMALQLGKRFDLAAWDGTWLYVPHLILTIAFVSLFLLALRRKFRR